MLVRSGTRSAHCPPPSSFDSPPPCRVPLALNPCLAPTLPLSPPGLVCSLVCVVPSLSANAPRPFHCAVPFRILPFPFITCRASGLTLPAWHQGCFPGRQVSRGLCLSSPRACSVLLCAPPGPGGDILLLGTYSTRGRHKPCPDPDRHSTPGRLMPSVSILVPIVSLQFPATSTETTDDYLQNPDVYVALVAGNTL